MSFVSLFPVYQFHSVRSNNCAVNLRRSVKISHGTQPTIMYCITPPQYRIPVCGTKSVHRSKRRAAPSRRAALNRRNTQTRIQRTSINRTTPQFHSTSENLTKSNHRSGSESRAYLENRSKSENQTKPKLLAELQSHA